MAPFTVGAEGTAASVYLLAVPLKSVSTGVPAPLRAFTLNVYCWFTPSPVTLFVPHVASVAQYAEAPSVPSDCTYLLCVVS